MLLTKHSVGRLPTVKQFRVEYLPSMANETSDRVQLLQGTLDMLILRTLEATGQNKTRAAEILGVSLKTLHNKLKEYGRERHETES